MSNSFSADYKQALSHGVATNTANDVRQSIAHEWATAAFGVDSTKSLRHRGLRMLEEAIELYQACGCDVQIAHDLIDYVFARPTGELVQEVGGVRTTLLVLAATAGISADEAEARELSRIISKPLEHFTKRDAEKNAAGFADVQ